MIKKLLSFVIMASAMFSLSSCLKDNNEEVTYYDDTAVTAFSLGTLNKNLLTKAKDGVTDTIVKTTFSASTTRFYIDQAQKQIYNPDSLPYGTDPSKVVANITTKNSGTVVLNLKDREGKDSLARYVAAEAIDFRKTVRVRVYNMRSTAFREYTVKVNIHQQTGDEVSWGSTSQTALAAVGARKMVSNGSQIFLFGQKDGQTLAFKKSGNNFTPLDKTFSANAYKNVVASNGYLYVLDNGSIMRSADGQTWSRTAQAAPVTQLIGGSDTNLYAIGDGSIMRSADNGASWTASPIGDDAGELPAENISFACFASKANAQTNTLILIGTRDGQTKVWSKVEENATGAQNQPWVFYNKDAYNKHTLPSPANLQVVACGSSLVAQGGDLSTFYVSEDRGITWFADSRYKPTAGFGKDRTPFAMTCDNTNTIHISKAGSAEVWTCRLARMAWAENQQAFTK